MLRLLVAFNIFLPRQVELYLLVLWMKRTKWEWHTERELMISKIGAELYCLQELSHFVQDRSKYR